MTTSAIPAFLQRSCRTSAPSATVLIRLYVGVVFAAEGILKFLRPQPLGSGRFAKAGIPAADFFANLDGAFEIVCGVLLLVGLFTRLAAAPMIIDMLGALLITKFPILWANAPLFKTEHGWWDFLHEARLDIAQLCGGIFLLLVGAGTFSLDRYVAAPAGGATGWPANARAARDRSDVFIDMAGSSPEDTGYSIKSD